MASDSPRTRRRLTAEERRAGILDAALQVFSRRGYHASSIDEIAQAAGISKALIYEHFESKHELHLSLIDLYADELFERVAGAAAPGPAAPVRLESGLDAFFSFVEERRGAWRMLFFEAADLETAAALDRMTAQVAGLVTVLIAEDPSVRFPAEDDEARRTGIEMIAQMVVGSAQGLANWWSDHQEVPRERIVAIVMDFAWLGLARMRAGERWQDVRRAEGG